MSTDSRSLSTSPSLTSSSSTTMASERSAPRATKDEERQLADFTRQYVNYRVRSVISPAALIQLPPVLTAAVLTSTVLALSCSTGYKLTEFERMQQERCRVSHSGPPSLVAAIASYYVAYPLLGRYTSSNLIRFTAFFLPWQAAAWFASQNAEYRCLGRFSMNLGSPLAHDIRTAARQKWADTPWLEARLAPFNSADTKTAGTGLPILYTIPSVTDANSSASSSSTSSTSGRSGDSHPVEDDLPLVDDGGGLQKEGESVPAKRPLLSVNVNERTLFSLPPGRTSVSSTTAASAHSSSAVPPLAPSSSPSFTGSRSSQTTAAATSSSGGRRDGGKGRSVWGEAEDEFGLDDDDGSRTRVKTSGRADEAERRQRREERQRVEADRNRGRSGGASGGERRRGIRRNEFGDEIEDG